jgi:hypothetical protein
LTRSAEVAAYWALLDGDDDEGRGAILIFNRRSLERRYKVEAVPDVYWHTETLFHDQAEEEIWDNVCRWLLSIRRLRSFSPEPHLLPVLTGSLTLLPVPNCGGGCFIEL